MKIFTIGFTKTTAQNFFERLQRAGVRKLIDVRLNNSSQLAGFAKRDDLKYFARQICNIEYEHIAQFAPTPEILSDYKNNGGDWDTYAAKFSHMLKQRHLQTLNRAEFESCCLLCSEEKPHHCHRRLVAEYLAEQWGDVTIEHL